MAFRSPFEALLVRRNAPDLVFFTISSGLRPNPPPCLCKVTRTLIKRAFVYLFVCLSYVCMYLCMSVHSFAGICRCVHANSLERITLLLARSPLFLLLLLPALLYVLRHTSRYTCIFQKWILIRQLTFNCPHL